MHSPVSMSLTDLSSHRPHITVLPTLATSSRQFMRAMKDRLFHSGNILQNVEDAKTFSYLASLYRAVSSPTTFLPAFVLSSLPLLKRSGTILMQSTPGGVDPEDVKHDLQMLPQIDAVHDLHVWVLNQKKAVATAHVVVNNETVKSLDDFMHVANTVNECLHAYGIHSTTLQPEIGPADKRRTHDHGDRF